jgi:hypothetical protein
VQQPTFDARRLAGKPTCSAYYFFMVVVIIRYETTAAARWALLFIVRTFFNDAFTVAVWTSFHTCLMWMTENPSAKVMQGDQGWKLDSRCMSPGVALHVGAGSLISCPVSDAVRKPMDVVALPAAT